MGARFRTDARAHLYAHCLPHGARTIISPDDITGLAPREAVS